eukprot:GHVU01194160.1.p2 GENE.GHVU01194160.1~~GHVU01194160.1.p2  ORF type:complete len:143 (+),score=18.37 GHVU01194160.1:1169-1597(+)
MSVPRQYFEDKFQITSVDKSKFEKVARLRGRSVAVDAFIVLDVHSELMPVETQQVLLITLTNRIDQGPENYKSLMEPTAKAMLDDYDYCMVGKIFRVEDKSADKRSVYASFGGLLMSLTGDKQSLADLELDMRTYLLVKKTA